MSSNKTEFDQYDKPGAERSRRRRGEDDDIESDLEEELLEDDGWTSSKKVAPPQGQVLMWTRRKYSGQKTALLTCPDCLLHMGIEHPLGLKNHSEMSDEELNDDLLQSDDEDISINASYSTSYNQQDDLQETDYADDAVNLGAEGYDEGEEYQQEGDGAEYTEEYSQDNNTTEMHEDQTDYSAVPAEGDDGYQDEVLDLEINEPLDSEFQDDEYSMSYEEKPLDEHGDQVSEAPEEEEFAEEEVSSTAESSQVESEAVPESREESDEEDEEDEESGRLRFKSERKEGAVVRLADAGRKRSNIPETLELSEKAKADLKEFEEQEEKKRQSRFGRGRGGRGGRGRGGPPGFMPQDMRGNRNRRMNDQRYPFMGNINMQHQSLRMPPPHPPQHHPRPRGPPPFSETGRPLVQQPLQPLMPPHMTHRSPPLRSQMEPPPPPLMSSPPPGFPQHHQQAPPPPQPKNIHINPHFRGPATSVQVPLMPPAQSQPRPAVGPPRFPGQGDFQQHMSNFGQPQRPPPHMEPFRSQPPPGPQDREPLFMGEHTDSPAFPGQPIYEHHGPLLSTPLHPQQLPGQGHMGFGPPGPTFNQPGHGPLGLFQREPPRPSLPPHQGQGMVGLNQGGLPNPPRHFMSPRQPFGQPRNHFNVPVQFRMQPPHPQDSLGPHPHSAHAQQHHHQQQQPNEPRPMMHPGQNPFHPQQAHTSPRQLTPHSQNPQLRNMANRQRMATPPSKQAQNLPQRNSNLREVPVAPGNTNMNNTRPALSNTRPVARATPGVRPVQNMAVSGGGRGRGQLAARGKGSPQVGPGRPLQNEPTNTGAQDPEEDEETRQYRLKIEEQKRLREEILRRKELRRQMQAGVRKKELLDRLNTNPPPSQTSSQPQPVLQPPPQQHEQPPRPQQQRHIPPRQQNQTVRNPNLPTPIPPNGASQTLRARPMGNAPINMGPGNQQQHSGINPAQQQSLLTTPQPLQQQQRRNSGLQNANRPMTQIRAQNTIPTTPPIQTQAAPKPGAKRTVMQRARNAGPDLGQVPQKVRVIKLSAAGEKDAEITGVPVTPQNQGVQRKVTMAGQQLQGPNVPQQPNQGGLANTQQNRVVVSGRGRGRGGGQMGRGRPLPSRQNQKAPESGPATVSIEGLSSSTTEVQLKNLLRSIGPIEMFTMLPQHRKAIARFSSPQHAASFQTSFHRSS